MTFHVAFSKESYSCKHRLYIKSNKTSASTFWPYYTVILRIVRPVYFFSFSFSSK